VSRGYARLYILRSALVRAGLMGHVIQVVGLHDAPPRWNATWTDRAGSTHAEMFTTEASEVRAVARRHHPAPSSWHGLRHAYVSALVTAGLDPVHVAMAAGHSDPAFTLRTYAHPATDSSTRIRAAQSHVDVDGSARILVCSFSVPIWGPCGGPKRTFLLVGVTGFEPAASSSRTTRGVVANGR
jgi:hypothetical protein